MLHYLEWSPHDLVPHDVPHTVSISVFNPHNGRRYDRELDHLGAWGVLWFHSEKIHYQY